MSELPPDARALVVTASNRAAAGVYADETGPLLAAWLRERGFGCDEPVVVPDGAARMRRHCSTRRASVRAPVRWGRARCASMSAPGPGSTR